MSKAILLISHGSRSNKTKIEIELLVNKLKAKTNLAIIEYAFLELEIPSIPEGIDICALKGASEIVVLLNFLNAGRHVDNDIPTIVNKSAQRYPRIKFSITQPVGQHDRIVDLFTDLIFSS